MNALRIWCTRNLKANVTGRWQGINIVRTTRSSNRNFTANRNNINNNSSNGKQGVKSSNRPDDDQFTDWKDVMEFVKDISLHMGLGVSIAYCFTEYGFSTTACEGPSMMPTLQEEGDVVLVEKFSHRLFGIHGSSEGMKRSHFNMMQNDENSSSGYSFRKDETVDDDSVIFDKLTSGIKVGDVVVSRHPHNDGTICKRVVALPGDRVELHPKYRPIRNKRKSDLIVVPDGHIWLEGDNTRNSNDSRHYGSVPASLIVGKVLLRIWPLRGKSIIGRQLPESKTQNFTGSYVYSAGELW
eukprot:CAMPEP_0116054554 /NCGR_PEP_ID=MMETSP0322-20121206/2871_1 /TAXON_ID=163516 /ORGANISM="Leptocylindrus danicus var. apora, Strain B651" /LENGTH=296 /DNA_ID=CAMNT_0003537969 /DNA_START=354 /DNA_END=1244 /DNA_ORIENTATION=-